MALGLALNKKLLMDTVITNVIVSNATPLMNKVLKIDVNNPLLQPIVGGGLGLLAGIAMKNSNMQNIALGLLITNVINPFVSKMLLGEALSGLADYDYIIDENEMGMSAYLDTPEVSKNYANYY